MDSNFTLINFDKKAKWFLLFMIGGFLLLSAFGIHTSNIASWDLFFGTQNSDSVIAGKPRLIRMDEWMVTTPSVLSQHELGFPIENPGIGGSKAPIALGMPIKNFSSVLKPSTWPYFIFDIEKAFAFSWNFNIFFFVISMFLLFMLLTRNQFWLSASGAFLVFFSSGIQWWSYFMATPMLYLNGILISLIYLLFAQQIRLLVIASVIFCICVFSFLTWLYPAFQVPLVYLYSLILAGYLFKGNRISCAKNKWQIKSAIATVALLTLCIILYRHYSLAKDTFETMMNTAYPGSRFSTGGDLVGGKLFADFFGVFMTDTHVPKQWLNICEASAGIMFFPIIFYSMIFHFFKHRKTDLLLVSLSAFVVLLLTYILIGFWSPLSKLSLFSMSPSYRALPVLGVGNSIFLICFLGSSMVRFSKSDFSWTEFVILTVAILIFMFVVSSRINASTGNFFSIQQVIVATALIMLVYLLTRYKDMKFAKPVLCGSLLLITIPNISANPLTRGLSPILENPLVQTTREIHQRDPEPGWAVYGEHRLAQLLIANGINVLNGVKYVPPLDNMRFLDPDAQYETIYNRYAWITMNTYMDGKDSVIFKQTFNDGYTIFVDPCSSKLKQLQVKYFVFSYQPHKAETRCMTSIQASSRIRIYQRNDE